jgi:isocitrate lyase
VRSERTSEGFFALRGGFESCVARGLAYASYADLLWRETSTPDLEEARRFAEAIHARFPGKLLAYNSSPSFNWKKNLDDATIARFQRELGAMGYKFQFVRLAGFHALNHGMFQLAQAYRDHGMAAYTGRRRQSSAPRTWATARRGTSARCGPATSTRSRRSSPPDAPPPWPWTSQRRGLSSPEPGRETLRTTGHGQ